MKTFSLLPGTASKISAAVIGVLLVGAITFATRPSLSIADESQKPRTDLQTNDSRARDQAQAMADVGYRFANLWFATANTNWPLAKYYSESLRSHLKSAIEIRPIRTTKSGGEVNLERMLKAVTDTMDGLDGAIDSKSVVQFENAFHQTMAACYSCHAACDKAYLRLRIPETDGSKIIDFAPH
jgi:hypothetical protein